MRLAEINFDVPDFVPTPEQWAQVTAAHIYGGVPDLDKEKGTVKYRWSSFLVDLDLMPVIPLTIKQVIRNDKPLGLDIETSLRPLQVNQKVNVAVPGLGLLLLNETKVAVDCCTDSLNDHLKEGWRIVAVCPQPDQRRPDYILGRVNKEIVE